MSPGPAHSEPDRPRPRRRDRRGRGLRGQLAPDWVPLARSRAAAFDELVLDAVDALEASVGAELADVQFGVEDVPDVPLVGGVSESPDLVLDGGVPLGRLYRHGPDGSPLVVVYRRPLETRAPDVEERGDVVFAVIAELVSELLGRDLGPADDD